MGRLAVAMLAVAAGLFVSTALGGALWQEQEQRLRIGAKILPACLGSVEDLSRLRAKDGDLLILMVHADMAGATREVEQLLAGVTSIRGLPVRLETLSADALERRENGPVAAIFVIDPEISAARMQDWGRRLGALVFSPFPGHVEDGAVAGIYVADRILPFVNLRRARAAGLGFKPFFLEVARTHE